MRVEVLLLVGRLIKGQSAAIDWTYIGFLSCVNPKMIKKIVPLSKNFSTMRVVTCK